MKKLLVILFVLSSVFAKSQLITQYLGTPKSVVSVRGWIKPDSGLVIPNLDTTTAPNFLGEVRYKTSDSTVYIGISISDSQKWMKLRGYVPTGVGTGTVQSVGASFGGSVVSVSGTPVTGTGTLAFTWNGAGTDVVLGNGSYTPFSAAITNVTDALYSPIGHSHIAADISDFTSAVRSSISAGTGITITDGVIAWNGSASGITSLNGLTGTTQTFATGTSGTDFNIVSSGTAHTFNFPTVSGTNRGLVTSTLYNTWNGKQDAITLTTTGTIGAATFDGTTLNIPQYSGGASLPSLAQNHLYVGDASSTPADAGTGLQWDGTNLLMSSGGEIRGGSSAKIAISDGGGSFLEYGTNFFGLGGSSANITIGSNQRMGIDGTSAWLGWGGGNHGIDLMHADGTVKIGNLNDATGVAKMVTTTDGVLGYQAIPGGAVPLSSITAATTTNTIDNGSNVQEWQWNALAGGIGFKLTSSSTAATGGFQTLAEISLTGINANSAESTRSLAVSNQHTGTSSINTAIDAQAIGGNINYGVSSTVSGGSINYGFNAQVSGGSTTNYGILAQANGGINAYGAYVQATGASNNYGLVVAEGRVGIGTATPVAAALVELSSTTQAFLIMRMTSTQASAIGAADGMMLYVTDTNGTFTSVGFWGYENGTWIKF